MKCPVDGTTLQLAERAGLEIDFCPDCRGIWLDRGELDELIDPSVQSTAMDALRAVRDLADAHKRKGSGTSSGFRGGF